MASLNLFKDILPSILSSKKNVFEEEHQWKDYSAFMVNRALSYHQDCIFQANQMNIFHELPKRAQYDFLMGTIRGRKRPFQRWASTIKDEDITLVMTAFDYSRDKAIAAIKCLTEEQMSELRKLYSEST